MDFEALLSRIFTLIFIAIIYYIIFKALILMGKDMKKRTTGEEEYSVLVVVDTGENRNLRKGAEIPLRGEVTLGRKNDNTVVLSDPYVSSHHIRFFRNEGRYVVEDMGSTNGTLLNGEKLKMKTYLKDGDVISIGGLSLKTNL